jgi:ferredoxin-NADP reductase
LEDAGFDEDIRQEVASSHDHGFRALEERGHHYELYLTSGRGRMTADYVDERVPQGVLNKTVFLCGPSPMVASLIDQFRALGLEDRHIVVEDFNLV